MIKSRTGRAILAMVPSVVLLYAYSTGPATRFTGAPGDDPGGIFVTMLIGIAGAIIGGLIASALDVGDLDEFFDIGTWLIAIAGSLLLLAIYRAIAGRGDRNTAVRRT